MDNRKIIVNADTGRIASTISERSIVPHRDTLDIFSRASESTATISDLFNNGLNQAISHSDLRKDQPYTVVWVTDEEVEGCMVCRTPFTFLNRRHHCRSCGSVVCSGCSGHRKEVYGLYGRHRVCDECIDNGVWENPPKNPLEPQEQEESDEFQRHREHLHQFYSKYAPQNLDKVDMLLEKYENGMDEMFRALYNKYNVPYSPSQEPTTVKPDSPTLTTPPTEETIYQEPSHATSQTSSRDTHEQFQIEMLSGQPSSCSCCKVATCLLQ